MDHAQLFGNTTSGNSLKNVNVPQKQFFRVFIIPKEGGKVFGSLSCDSSTKLLAGDESHNVYMPHKTQYSIMILNISTSTAEADIKIDGKFIGLFYCPPLQYTEIKRSPRDDKGFVFTSICENSSKADSASENISSQYRG